MTEEALFAAWAIGLGGWILADSVGAGLILGGLTYVLVLIAGREK